jgi:hypothetical protein
VIALDQSPNSSLVLIANWPPAIGSGICFLAAGQGCDPS